MTKLLQWNDPKMKISVVAGSFHFRTRRNDTRSSFHGMTGTRLERPTLFGKGSPNGEKGGSNDLGFTVIPIFHSCHSDRIPRSKVVLSHSGRKGTFRMTSERCRNEGRGGAEVGCFPQRISHIHFELNIQVAGKPQFVVSLPLPEPEAPRTPCPVQSVPDY